MRPDPVLAHLSRPGRRWLQVLLALMIALAAVPAAAGDATAADATLPAAGSDATMPATSDAATAAASATSSAAPPLDEAGGPTSPASAGAAAKRRSAADGLITLSLAQAETVLLDRNQTIASARYGIAAAQAGQVIAAYRPNPALTLSAEQFNVRRPLAHLDSDDPDSEGYQHFYTVRVDQTIERGGKRGLRELGSSQQTESAKAALQDAIRQQLFGLRQSYVTAVEDRELLQVAREMLAITEQNEGIIAAEVDAGAAAQADLVNFQVNRLQFQQGVISAEQACAQSVGDLLNVLDLTRIDEVGKPGSGSAATGAIVIISATASAIRPEEVVLPDTLDRTPREFPPGDAPDLAEGRCDVIAARFAMAAAETGVKGARALTHEDVDLGLEYQRNGGDDTVGVAVQFNLPEWNNHSGDIMQAQALYFQARTQYLQVRTQAITDIEKARQGLDAARRTLALYDDETVAKAREGLRIATGAYQEGGLSLLDLFAAQQAYDGTRVGFIQARAAYCVALASVEMATGRPPTP